VLESAVQSIVPDTAAGEEDCRDAERGRPTADPVA
jgi:hypothetical protein